MADYYPVSSRWSSPFFRYQCKRQVKYWQIIFNKFFGFPIVENEFFFKTLCIECVCGTRDGGTLLIVLKETLGNSFRGTYLIAMWSWREKVEVIIKYFSLIYFINFEISLNLLLFYQQETLVQDRDEDRGVTRTRTKRKKQAMATALPAAHKAYVQRLYRRALKTSSDWYWQRDEWRGKALLIRHLFEENRAESSPQKIQALLTQTEYWLAEYAHPQPYIRPTAPGGTKWERNVPFPEEVLSLSLFLLLLWPCIGSRLTLNDRWFAAEWRPLTTRLRNELNSPFL